MSTGRLLRVWRRDRRCLGTAPIAVCVAFVTVASCGLGQRSSFADRIIAAPARAEAGAVSGVITVESRFRQAPPGALTGAGFAPASLSAAPGGPAPGTILASGQARFSMDLRASSATLTKEGSEQPFAVVDDLVFYGRRHGVPSDDARPWVRLDLARVSEGAGALNPIDGDVGALAAVHPAVITDLAAGVLTGSVENHGRDDSLGVPTTRFTANVAVDKALTDTRRDRYPEERREHVEELLRLLGVDGEVHPAEIWLDDRGRLRRFKVELMQRPLKKVEFGLVVTVDYHDYSGEHQSAVPSAQEILTVDTVVRFVRTVGGGAAAETDGVQS